MKKIGTKKITKLIALMLVCFTVMITCTGCLGIAGADSAPKEADQKLGEGSPSGSNNLCVVWADNVTSVNTEGAQTTPGSFLWMVKLDAGNGDAYGTEVVDSYITYIRDFALIVFQSLFGSSVPYSDSFSGGGIPSFTLEPGALVRKLTDVLEGAILATSGAIDSLEGTAMAILIAMWSMGCISQIINEKFTPEVFLKTFMQLMCSILLIEHADEIVMALSDVGTLGLEGEADGSVFASFSEGISDILQKGILSINIGISISDIKMFQLGVGTILVDFGCVLALALMAIPFWAQINCAKQLISVFVMRTIELLVRIVFAPVSMAFGAYNGFSLGEIQYIRSTFACAVQPALMIVGIMCFNPIAELIMGLFGDGAAMSYVGGIIAMTLSYIVLSAYLGSTQSLAKEVLAR